MLLNSGTFIQNYFGSTDALKNDVNNLALFLLQHIDGNSWEEIREHGTTLGYIITLLDELKEDIYNIDNGTFVVTSTED